MPGSGELLTLKRRGNEYTLDVDGSLLMTSLSHASEDSLAEITCRRIRAVRVPSVLVGGLGMGYTLAAALKALGPQAKVAVCEISPGVVDWNRGPLSHLAGHPLKDRRVTVLTEDIALTLRRERAAYDAILQDVDNGPEGQTLKANDWLYSEQGLAEAAAALRPGGILALWSAKPNKQFVKRLRRCGFEPEELCARGRDKHRGAHYIIWLAVLSSHSRSLDVER